MSIRNFQFFARRHEIPTIFVSLLRKHGLWLVLHERVEVLDAERLESERELCLGDTDMVFIATAPPTDEQLKSLHVVPARLGWLHLDLPRESRSQLLLADFAMKNDWYDENTGNIHQNEELPKIYKKLRIDLQKQLSGPVWATNVKTGGVAKYSDMGVSAAARSWEADGGELRQQGVDNVRFSSREI